MDGVLIVNKDKDYTSRDIVNIVSKKLGTKKIGHTGTLDPLATGVLVLCVGKATKLVEVLTSSDKEYEAEVTLGILTDTLDITGNILKEEKLSLTDEEIFKAVTSMKGTYNQEVPIYSAIKINGKKLYEYARENIEITLPKREVDIKSIELIGDIKRENNKIIFNIKTTVSKGTYIRSLVYDIALKLNTIGVMSNLKRTRQGSFCLSESYTLDEINNDNYKLLSLDETLKDYYTVNVTDSLEKKIINGVKIPNTYGEKYVLFRNDEQIIALYKDEDNTLKVWKMF